MSLKQCLRNFKYKIRGARKGWSFEDPIRLIKNVRIGRNVSIGRFTYIKSGTIYGDVKIGRFCSIAENVAIGATSHPTSWLSTSPFCYGEIFKTKSTFVKYDDPSVTIIGNDVWIGANSVIRKGIIVGDGAVIGAGSVVVKNVPPYAIVGGIPAKIIKYRFDENTIQKLLELKWWLLEPEKLNNLPYDKINECIEKLKNNV